MKEKAAIVRAAMQGMLSCPSNILTRAVGRFSRSRDELSTEVRCRFVRSMDELSMEVRKNANYFAVSNPAHILFGTTALRAITCALYQNGMKENDGLC